MLDSIKEEALTICCRSWACLVFGTADTVDLLALRTKSRSSESLALKEGQTSCKHPRCALTVQVALPCSRRCGASNGRSNLSGHASNTISLAGFCFPSLFPTLRSYWDSLEALVSEGPDINVTASPDIVPFRIRLEGYITDPSPTQKARGDLAIVRPIPLKSR